MRNSFERTVAIVLALLGSLLAEVSGGLQVVANESYAWERVDQAVAEGLKKENCPGAAVAIVYENQIVHLKGYGIANIDTQALVTADMLFRVGSTTKMFTAAAALLSVEDKKLELHQPIGEVIDASAIDPSIKRLTVHQLLTHTAGLADPNAMFGPHDESALAERIARFRSSDFFDEPNQIYSYSNAGYWIAGYVIEMVEKKKYADVLDERLFQPLGMNRTTFRPTEAMTWPLAVGHGPESDSAPFVIRPLADNAAAWPAGQMFSNASEFARFCITFMNRGIVDGQQVLPEKIIDQMSSPWVKVPNDERHYGYGLSIRDVDGLRWVSHSGSRTGYGSHVRMCPDQKFAVVILCNKTGIGLTSVADVAAGLVLGVEPISEPKNREVEMTDSERSRLVGIYVNNGNRVSITEREGKLFDARGRRIDRVDDNRYVARRTKDIPSAEFSFVFEEEKARYLMLRGRAYKKQ